MFKYIRVLILGDLIERIAQQEVEIRQLRVDIDHLLGIFNPPTFKGGK